jgi:hypothetical protein
MQNKDDQKNNASLKFYLCLHPTISKVGMETHAQRWRRCVKMDVKMLFHTWELINMLKLMAINNIYIKTYAWWKQI